MEPAEFFNVLTRNKFDFYCGVPDSLLKDFCAYVTDNVPPNRHIITANEGNAIALASGYHLATGKSAVVYLQVHCSIKAHKSSQVCCGVSTQLGESCTQ